MALSLNHLEGSLQVLLLLLLLHRLGVGVLESGVLSSQLLSSVLNVLQVSAVPQFLLVRVVGVISVRVNFLVLPLLLLENILNLIECLLLPHVSFPEPLEDLRLENLKFLGLFFLFHDFLAFLVNLWENLLISMSLSFF